jgi:hypothetical protein
MNRFATSSAIQPTAPEDDGAYDRLLAQIRGKRRTLALALIGRLNMRPDQVRELQDELWALEAERDEFLGHDW